MNILKLTPSCKDYLWAVKPPASSERDKKKTAALCGVFFFIRPPFLFNRVYCAYRGKRYSTFLRF